MEQNNIQQNNTIIIDDGSKTYTIKDRQGKALATFCFRPSDTNIISRYKEVEKFFRGFKVTEEDPDIEEYEKKVIAQMDYLVNAETGESFFGIMGPFSPMPDGSLFYEVCLNAVCNVINQELYGKLQMMIQELIQTQLHLQLTVKLLRQQILPRLQFQAAMSAATHQRQLLETVSTPSLQLHLTTMETQHLQRV